MKFVSPVGAHAVRPVKKYVILSRRSATKDRKMRRLFILRSFAVCAAQDDGDFFTASQDDGRRNVLNSSSVVSWWMRYRGRSSGGVARVTGPRRVVTAAA